MSWYIYFEILMISFLILPLSAFVIENARFRPLAIPYR